VAWRRSAQIQFVNNRLIEHRRTAFRDWPDAQRKRLLYRLWLRDWGRPFYNGYGLVTSPPQETHP
jgi:hypothetical protein